MLETTCHDDLSIQVDRHVLQGHGKEIAVIEDHFEWNESGLGQPTGNRQISRNDMLIESARAALVLGELGLHQGKCAVFAMPNVADQIIWIEACKRLAVVYTAVAPNVSAHSLAERVEQLGSEVWCLLCVLVL